jgi:phosphohistidine phosphatase
VDLLIVRHAIAFEQDVKRWRDDGERPLSPEGMARARKAAAGLKRLAPTPSLVLVSPLKRAQQTAAILTRCAGWPAPVTAAQLLPGASPAALFTRLAGSRDPCIAVVGHEPGLGRLITASLPGEAGAGAFELKKMGVALIEFPGTPRAGQGALVWLSAPKLLRAAR